MFRYLGAHTQIKCRFLKVPYNPLKEIDLKYGSRLITSNHEFCKHLSIGHSIATRVHQKWVNFPWRAFFCGAISFFAMHLSLPPLWALQSPARQFGPHFSSCQCSWLCRLMRRRRHNSNHLEELFQAWDGYSPNETQGCTLNNRGDLLGSHMSHTSHYALSHQQLPSPCPLSSPAQQAFEGQPY